MSDDITSWSPEDGVVLATGPVPDFTPSPSSPLDVMPVLTRRQLRLGLLDLSITVEMVDAVIDAMPEGERAAARIEWQDSSEYRRDHPLVAQIGAALEVDAATIDAAWAAAARL